MTVVRMSMLSQQMFPEWVWKNKTQTFSEEPTWLLCLREWNMARGANTSKLYINRHDGDEEKLVNGCGGHQYCDKNVWNLDQHTCFFCSRGMCVLCRVEESKERIKEKVRWTRGQPVSTRGVRIHTVCFVAVCLHHCFSISISVEWKIFLSLSLSFFKRQQHKPGKRLIGQTLTADVQ